MKNLSTDLIKKFYKETKGKIQIIGGGRPGYSAFEKYLGSNVVQLYTGMVYKALEVKEMKKELISIIKKILKILEKQSECLTTLISALYSLRKITSKRCELTGISPLKGHNVSHAKNKTKRRFLPNLKKVTFRSDILKKDIKLNVANAALRTVDFKGGLDKFLISAKNSKLSKKVKKIKASISAKS